MGLPEGARAEWAGCAGTLHADALSGLDVFVPEGTARLREALRDEAVRSRYGLAVVDAPPMHSEGDGLLECCGEAVAVSRVEPLGLRTVEGLLRAMQAQKSKRSFRFHGLLLNLPEGMEEGSEEMAGLRGVYRGQVLPLALEHDEAVERAALHRQPVALAAPDSRAGAGYRELAEMLRVGETTPSPAVAEKPAAEAAPEESGIPWWAIVGVTLAVTCGMLLGRFGNWFSGW